MKYPLLLFFLIAGATDLYFIHFDLPYRQFSKPLIVLSLMGYYLIHLKSLKESAQEYIFLGALIAAWLGDVFLLWDNMFLFGLGSFLLMQVLYTYCFIRDRGKEKLVYILGLLILPFSGYILSLMWSDLGSMRVPVLVYLLAIVLMALAAAMRRKEMSGYYLVVLGTLFFLASDAVLALHKFTSDIHLGGMTVMATYIAAQYLIVEGYIQGHLKVVQAE